MANTLANLARMYTETTGTGTLTLTTAVPSFLTFDNAGVTDGATVTYALYCGPHREIGAGVYTASGLTLTRATVYSSTNGGSKISLTGRSEVFITAAKEDFDTFLTTADAATTYQPLDAQLTDIAGLTPTDSGVIIGNGSNFVLETGDTLRTSLGIREKLTANRTYYVRTDGSNSNTGLTDSAGGAFLTIQAAIDAFFALDVGGFVVTVQVRSGTFTGQISINGMPPGCTASNPLVVQGDTTTPSNVVISTTSQHAFIVSSGAEAYIQGFKIQTTTSGTGLQVSDHARVVTNAIEWGACATYHMEAKDGGEITLTGDYTISGSAVAHQHCTSNGYILYIGGTITLTGTPAFSAYYVGANNAYVQYGTTTFSGSATGIRHYIHNNASVYTDGSYQADYFPGNTAGVLMGASCIDDYDGAVVLANTGLQVDDTDASHQLTIKPGSNLSADRTLTITTGDADRTLDISAGSVTISTFGAQLIDDATAAAAATTLGLGTGDSPQFTAVNVGAATDTTLSRSSAGLLAVEGVNIPTEGRANTFTAANNFTLTTDFTAPVQVTSTNASANAGPYILFKRNSASPAINDDGGALLYQMNDDAVAAQTYAEIGVRSTAVAAGAISGVIRIKTQVASAYALRASIGAGMWIGSPTGTDKGVGTLNAVAVYDDSVLLCAPVEYMKSGTVNTAMWDGFAIDEVEPEETLTEIVEIDVHLSEPEKEIRQDRDGTFREVEIRTKKATPLEAKPILNEKGEQVDIAWVPQTRKVVKPAKVRKRRNELAHEFKAMLDEGFDPRDPKAYFDKMLADEALPGLKTKANWVPNEESNAKRTNRIILALELQTAVVKTLYERLEALEAKVKK